VAVEGETDPESKPKVLSLELEVELTLGLVAVPLAWPGWFSRASSVTARKPAAAAATAVFFAPAARRRAASILVGGLVTVCPVLSSGSAGRDGSCSRHSRSSVASSDVEPQGDQQALRVI
jgi:hypothetical protein